MDNAVLIAFGVTLFAGLATALGSVLVFRASTTNPRLLAFGLAFAAGAMVYVSLVEIFPKSVNSFSEVFPGQAGYLRATLAFFAGVMVVLLLDRLLPNPHTALGSSIGPSGGTLSAALAPGATVPRELPAPPPASLLKVAVLAAVAITAHNLPEGMATFFATLQNPAVGIPLAAAIAIHNIPEGVAIAIPIYYVTQSRWKATLAAAASGLAEPLGALLGYLLLAPFLSPVVYGIVFGMVAGVMVFLSLDELLPAAKRYAKGHETVYGMVLGMALLATSLVLFK